MFRTRNLMICLGALILCLEGIAVGASGKCTCIERPLEPGVYDCECRFPADLIRVPKLTSQASGGYSGSQGSCCVPWPEPWPWPWPYPEPEPAPEPGPIFSTGDVDSHVLAALADAWLQASSDDDSDAQREEFPGVVCRCIRRPFGGVACRCTMLPY